MLKYICKIASISVVIILSILLYNNVNLKEQSTVAKIIHNVNGNISPSYNYANPPVIFLEQDSIVKLLREMDNFCEIEFDNKTCWIPKWYIDQSNKVKKLETEIWVVKIDSDIMFYPEEKNIDEYRIESIQKGKIAIVKAEYNEWYSIDLITYSEPYYDNVWIHKSRLSDPTEMTAIEGYLKKGADAFNFKYELINNEVESIISISDYDDELYVFSTFGGVSGLIKKEDFVPIVTINDIVK